MMNNMQAETLITSGLANIGLQEKRVIVIIPDTTRTAPVGRNISAWY
jgi:hypothetical protein